MLELSVHAGTDMSLKKTPARPELKLRISSIRCAPFQWLPTAPERLAAAAR